MLSKEIILDFIGVLFLALGIFLLKIAFQKVSYMERQRLKGVELPRYYSRGFFLLFASVCIFCGIKLLGIF
jgi:hypothetical protein